ncbi:rhomboid family intramembrane serine protease [Candidatus Bathyarchaeota archaeon]|nr:rhomboid family intramembrane serine protease [Candidatus Bathyarchaeota archaeon]
MSSKLFDKSEAKLFRFTSTTALIAINLAVYAFTSMVGGNFLYTDRNILLILGQYNDFVMSGGWWQLFTAMFVHVDLSHFLGNMLFLLIFGIRGEELFSDEEFFSIYFVGGLAGNLLTLLMGPSTVSAGASGAIFAMFGACVIYLRRTLGQSIMGALIYSFYLFILSAGARVNVFAHFGGLAAGLAIGYTLAKSRKSAKSSLSWSSP